MAEICPMCKHYQTSVIAEPCFSCEKNIVRTDRENLRNNFEPCLKNKTTWKDKSEATREALSASAQYMLINEKEFRFRYKGKRYVMRVEEMEEEQG